MLHPRVRPDPQGDKRNVQDLRMLGEEIGPEEIIDRQEEEIAPARPSPPRQVARRPCLAGWMVCAVPSPALALRDATGPLGG